MGLNLQHLRIPASILASVADLALGELVFPRRPDSGLAFLHFTVLMEKPCLESHTLPDRSFMLIQSVWRRVQRGQRGNDEAGIHLTDTWYW